MGDSFAPAKRAAVWPRPRREPGRWPVPPVAGRRTADLPLLALSLLEGDSPWRFFDGVIDESGCRSPQLSDDGYAALAVCRGADPDDPRDLFGMLLRAR